MTSSFLGGTLTPPLPLVIIRHFWSTPPPPLCDDVIYRVLQNQVTMITTMMWVIIVIIILVLLMILVLKMTKKYHITWYWCQNIRENMVEKRVKKFGQCPKENIFFFVRASLIVVVMGLNLWVKVLCCLCNWHRFNFLQIGDTTTTSDVTKSRASWGCHFPLLSFSWLWLVQSMASGETKQKTILTKCTTRPRWPSVL